MASKTLPAWDSESGLLHVIVDTPKGSATKFKHDTKKDMFKIAHVLPPGAAFPYDFGSIPSTVAEDGDPLDVLVLLETPTFPGCLALVRIVGVLEAKQTQDGKTLRNDRLLGVAKGSRTYRDMRSIKDVPKHLLDEIEHFFVSYNQERGRTFRPLGRFGVRRAKAVIQRGERLFRKENARSA